MILIGQHGQWLLIIHSSYVVLIMIKLELLELDRLEYYLLEFDQGGKQKAGEQKQSDPNNLETTTNKVIFPITFTNNHIFHTFGIIASDTSIFWGNSGASVITRRISKIDMRYEVHSSYQSMLTKDSIIEWCVVGI